MRTMILYYNTNTYFFPYLKDINIKCFKVYKNVNKIISIIRKIPVLNIYAYGNWKKELELYNRIIIFDNAFDKNLAKFLKKNFFGKIFIYSWNTAISQEDKNLLIKAKTYFPVFSFDKNNCKELDLFFASMVYSNDIVSQFTVNSSLNYDVVFLGWDKGRRNELISLYDTLENFNLNCLFVVRDNTKKKLHEDFIITDQNIPYEDYLKILKSTKVIVDITKTGQEGITIRMVEALFFKKKVITNKKDIDTYDFYNKNNIFILGKDNVNDLVHFINTSYEEIPLKIVKKYDLKYWVDEYFI